MTIEVAGRAPLSWTRALSHPRVRTAFASVGLRLTVGALAVLVAFHYSLLTLIRDLNLDTPLAYLGMVPLIAIGMALALPRHGTGPDIQDRQLDHIIGLPIVVGSILAIRLLPDQLSTIYWDDRLDLPVLPIYLFGVSVLLFGLRDTWRYRVPIGYLFLAWPYPYALFLEHFTDASTSLAIGGLNQALKVFPVATQTPGGDGALFHVGAAAPHGFDVSIASACAGVNSMIGFLVVGVAFLAVVKRKPAADGAVRRSNRGITRKAIWLTLGLALVWVLNVGRLVLVLAVGKAWGETVAIDGLHPFIGIVIFAVAVAILMAAMPLFGLYTVVGQTRSAVLAEKTRLRAVADQARLDAIAAGVVPVIWPPTAAAAAMRDLLPSADEPRWMQWLQRLSVPPRLRGGWKIAASAVVAGAVVIGVTDSSFSKYELTSSDLGVPRLSSFDEHPAAFGGETPGAPQSYDWVRRYFGDSSTWHRYTYGGVAGGEVIADVIDAGGLSPFNAYNIEACYAFHGYNFSHQRQVSLGGGVDGFVLNYEQPDQHITWNVVYWVWKVQTSKGQRYERVVLLRPSSGDGVTADSGTIGAPQAQSSPFKGLGYNLPGGGSAGSDLAETQLIALAKQAVTSQPVATKTSATGAPAVHQG